MTTGKAKYALRKISEHETQALLVLSSVDVLLRCKTSDAMRLLKNAIPADTLVVGSLDENGGLVIDESDTPQEFGSCLPDEKEAALLKRWSDWKSLDYTEIEIKK